MSAASRTTSHLVIGGGLAGSMLGIRLAAAGCDVVLLEKERSAHHKVCGEFLSREAVVYLRQVGLDPLALGAATIRRVRLSAARKVVEANLPFTALSLSRYRLDEALLARAVDAGCSIHRGAFVERLTRRDALWLAELRGEEPWSAATVFLANGKHDLRGLERKQAAQRDLVGFKLHWRLATSQTDALRECMELFLFSGGYGGLSLVEGDTANLCLVVKSSEFLKAGGWSGLLPSILNQNPHLAERLQSATNLGDRPLAISPIPYGYLVRGPSAFWCVGDQAAVIPSFTGDGMSIALHSATLAAQMYLAGESADKYHRRLRAHLGRGMTLATWLSQAMVTTLGRTLAPIGLSVFPDALRWIAGSTRIPDQALVRSGAATRGTRRPAVP